MAILNVFLIKLQVSRCFSFWLHQCAFDYFLYSVCLAIYKQKYIKFRVWEKQTYAVKCVPLWYKLFWPSQLENVQRKKNAIYILDSEF